MNVRIKLYAMLSRYLPGNAVKNEADLEVGESIDVESVLTQLNMPLAECHLVLVNGTYIPPSERSEHRVSEGDHIAVWPPVAGG